MPQHDSTPPADGAVTRRLPRPQGRQAGRQGGRLALVGVALVAASAGYWIGHTQQTRTSAATLSAILAPSAEDATSVPASAASDPQHLIDRMAISVGQMQADLTRLNSLAQHLLETAGLDDDDFDLAAPAGAGGGPERVSLRPNRADEVAQDLAKVLGELDDRKRKLALLETLIKERDFTKGQSIPEGWPVANGGVITSNFGYRRHPISGRRAMHMGIDIAAKTGSDIVAMADGTVIFSGRKNGYGNIVELRHPNGLETRYAHNQRNLVAEGDRVRKGQVIGKVGSTGRSTGPHVHFEVRRNGAAVDPMRYLDVRDKSRLARL